MFVQRAPEDQIDKYTGPYERWVFTEELGRPFAFPAIRSGTATYFTGLLEGADKLPDTTNVALRLPPLWNPQGNHRAVTPFAFHDADGNADTTASAMLAALCDHHLGQGQIAPRFRVNFPVAPHAWTPDYHPHCNMDAWVVPQTRPKAIVAVIDDGIPFGHRAFLDQTGRTRMSHVWLQSAKAQDHGAVPFGRELMNGEINALRLAAGNDEDLFYRSAGAIAPDLPELGPHLRRHATHGSHVAGMCAGNDTRLSSHPLGDDIQIIAVQLPNTIAWDTSGFGKEMYMLSALHYVFARARAIAAKYANDPDNPDELPLIVNFSYGWSASRHDGGSEMELAIQELLSERKALQPKSAIVMPTGNNFHSDMHGQITAQDMVAGEFTFGWQVLPDDRTSSYLEIWLPEDFDPSAYTVQVRPPNGARLSAGGNIRVNPANSQTIGDPCRYAELEIDGQNIGQLSADKHRGQRWRVMLALIPTVYTAGQSRCAPAGQWRITLKQNAGPALQPAQTINVWVHRDDDPASLKTGGRQSRLVDVNGPHAAGSLGFIRGFGSLNGVASSPAVTRVAAYVASTQTPCYYSGSAGVTQNADGTLAPWGAPVTLTAMGDQSLALGGTRSIGVRSGSGTRLAGTSGAAPAASRLMAINAANGRDLMHGMSGQLPMRFADTSVAAQTSHTARTGTLTVPPVQRA